MRISYLFEVIEKQSPWPGLYRGSELLLWDSLGLGIASLDYFGLVLSALVGAVLLLPYWDSLRYGSFALAQLFPLAHSRDICPLERLVF